jgi:twinkle protein
MEFISEAQVMENLDPEWEKKILSTGGGVKNLWQLTQDWISRPDSEVSQPVPWSSLTKKFGGLREGEMTVFSGDTGMGKTTYCINLIYFLAKRNIPTLSLSLEMGPLAVVKKMFQMFTGHPQRIELAKENTAWHEWSKSAPVYVADLKGQYAYDKFKLFMAYAAIHKKAKVILVDHFHMLTNSEMKAAQLDEIIADMQRLATLLKTSLLVICHPAKLGGDGKERPIEMDQLKGSSGIKQYADNVISVHYFKDKNISKIYLKKIRHDDYGRFMGDEITYELTNQLLFKELD